MWVFQGGFGSVVRPPYSPRTPQGGQDEGMALAVGVLAGRALDKLTEMERELAALGGTDARPALLARRVPLPGMRTYGRGEELGRAVREAVLSDERLGPTMRRLVEQGKVVWTVEANALRLEMDWAGRDFEGAVRLRPALEGLTPIPRTPAEAVWALIEDRQSARRLLEGPVPETDKARKEFGDGLKEAWSLLTTQGEADEVEAALADGERTKAMGLSKPLVKSLRAELGRRRKAIREEGRTEADARLGRALAVARGQEPGRDAVEEARQTVLDIFDLFESQVSEPRNTVEKRTEDAAGRRSARTGYDEPLRARYLVPLLNALTPAQRQELIVSFSPEHSQDGLGSEYLHAQLSKAAAFIEVAPQIAKLTKGLDALDVPGLEQRLRALSELYLRYPGVGAGSTTARAFNQVLEKALAKARTPEEYEHIKRYAKEMMEGTYLEKISGPGGKMVSVERSAAQDGRLEELERERAAQLKSRMGEAAGELTGRRLALALGHIEMLDYVAGVATRFNNIFLSESTFDQLQVYARRLTGERGAMPAALSRLMELAERSTRALTAFSDASDALEKELAAAGPTPTPALIAKTQAYAKAYGEYIKSCYELALQTEQYDVKGPEALFKIVDKAFGYALIVAAGEGAAALPLLGGRAAAVGWWPALREAMYLTGGQAARLIGYSAAFSAFGMGGQAVQGIYLDQAAADFAQGRQAQALGAVRQMLSRTLEGNADLDAQTRRTLEGSIADLEAIEKRLRTAPSSVNWDHAWESFFFAMSLGFVLHTTGNIRAPLDPIAPLYRPPARRPAEEPAKNEARAPEPTVGETGAGRPRPEGRGAKEMETAPTAKAEDARGIPPAPAGAGPMESVRERFSDLSLSLEGEAQVKISFRSGSYVEEIGAIPAERLSEAAGLLESYLGRYPDVVAGGGQAGKLSTMYRFSDAYSAWAQAQKTEGKPCDLIDYLQVLQATQMPHQILPYMDAIRADIATHLPGREYDPSRIPARMYGANVVFDLPVRNADGSAGSVVFKLSPLWDDALAMAVLEKVGRPAPYKVIFDEMGFSLMTRAEGMEFDSFLHMGRTPGGLKSADVEPGGRLHLAVAREMGRWLADDQFFQFNDSHMGNYMISESGRLTRIDFDGFGYSTEPTTLDYIQLHLPQGTLTSDPRTLVQINRGFVERWEELRGAYPAAREGIKQSIEQNRPPSQHLSPETYLEAFDESAALPPQEAWNRAYGEGLMR